MAGVAGGRVVDVARHAIVVAVGLGLRVAAARDAAEDPKVRWVDVAAAALRPGMLTGVDREVRMAEAALVPRRVGRVVAVLTLGRESGSSVIRILAGIVIILMAGGTSCGSSSVTGRMAIDTG